MTFLQELAALMQCGSHTPAEVVYTSFLPFCAHKGPPLPVTQVYWYQIYNFQEKTLNAVHNEENMYKFRACSETPQSTLYYHKIGGHSCKLSYICNNSYSKLATMFIIQASTAYIMKRTIPDKAPLNCNSLAASSGLQ
jgi:hypothetical protein